MSRAVMQKVLSSLINLQPILGNGLLDKRQLAFIDPYLDVAALALIEELAKPELMRMPKIDDRVVFIEGGIEGTVRLISHAGGPHIKFDDGTGGQWSLYEFGEMFYYQGKE